jgi:hypothetical protein
MSEIEKSHRFPRSQFIQLKQHITELLLMWHGGCYGLIKHAISLVCFQALHFAGVQHLSLFEGEFMKSKFIVIASVLSMGIAGAAVAADQKGMSGMSGMEGQKGMSGMSGMEGQKGMSGMSGMEGQKGMSGMSGMEGKKKDDQKDKQKGMSGMSGMEGQKGMSGMSGMEGKK